MFSLLSAEDREKLKRVSDSAKQVLAGQTSVRAHDGASPAETSSKSDDVSSDGKCIV